MNKKIVFLILTLLILIPIIYGINKVLNITEINYSTSNENWIANLSQTKENDVTINFKYIGKGIAPDTISFRCYTNADTNFGGVISRNKQDNSYKARLAIHNKKPIIFYPLTKLEIKINRDLEEFILKKINTN